MRRLTPCLLPLFAAVLACGEAAVEPQEDATGHAVTRSSVWLTPNVGSTDLLRLFEEPDRWRRARSRVSVLKLYAQQLAADAPAQCPMCGDNLFPNFARAGAFRRLGEWRIALGVEAGAVKHHTCRGADAAAAVSAVADRVQAEGGELRYVAMDEPLLGGEMVVGGQSCRYTMGQSAAEVAAFMGALAAAHPGLEVGDVEPYPAVPLWRLEAWVDELLRVGARPAFLHLDVDRLAVKNARADVSGDLRRLRDFLSARGIPFGVVFWGHEADIPKGAQGEAADRAYYDAVMKWTRTVASAIGAPEHAVFQSWLESPGGARVVPRNLDESGFSHTRLLNDGCDALGIPAPGAPAQPAPSAPRGDASEIRVARAYLGILGREADAGGLAGWAAALRNGMRLTDLCRSLFGSPEFAAHRAQLSPEDLAVALYRGLLGREPDPGGLAGTVSEIRAGRRAERAAAMLDSPEFQERFLR